MKAVAMYNDRPMVQYNDRQQQKLRGLFKFEIRTLAKPGDITEVWQYMKIRYHAAQSDIHTSRVRPE